MPLPSGVGHGSSSSASVLSLSRLTALTVSPASAPRGPTKPANSAAKRARSITYRISWMLRSRGCLVDNVWTPTGLGSFPNWIDKNRALTTGTVVGPIREHANALVHTQLPVD